MKSTRAKPACDQLTRWLSENLGSLGALTGTDWRALTAAAHILELRTVLGDDGAVLSAFRVVVMFMQPKTREFAYHAIAHYGDWDDRARVWQRALLPTIDRPWVCAGEPGGSARQ